MTRPAAWKRCIVHAAHLPAEAREDIEEALRAVDPGFPRLVDGLATDFGLRGNDSELRQDGCILEFAAIQVADDLADGDCNYLEDPARSGPGVHWLLQHLTYRCLLESRAPRVALKRAAHDLTLVGGAQQSEVRTGTWTYANAASMAQGLNGRQYSAYFRILSAGSRHMVRAARAGADFGFALHVVTDRATQDRRWNGTCRAQWHSIASGLRRVVP
jgi:hypothetical protein